MKPIHFIIAVIVCCSAATVSAESVYSGNVNAELLADVSSVAAGKSFSVGLKMTMDDGWHTYWRNSGDSGMKTKIRWTLPDGFKAGELQWPIPQRFEYASGLIGYGYEGEVILLTRITTPPALTDDTVSLNAKVSWLSCEEICVPGKANFSMELPVEELARPNEKNLELFMQTKQHWPVDSEHWHVTAREQEDIFLITLSTDMELLFQITEIDFYPYRNDVIDHAGKQLFNALDNGYELSVNKSSLLEAPLEHLEGVLLINGLTMADGYGMHIRVPVGKN